MRTISLLAAAGAIATSALGARYVADEPVDVEASPRGDETPLERARPALAGLSPHPAAAVPTGDRRPDLALNRSLLLRVEGPREDEAGAIVLEYTRRYRVDEPGGSQTRVIPRGADGCFRVT